MMCRVLIFAIFGELVRTYCLRKLYQRKFMHAEFIYLMYEDERKEVILKLQLNGREPKSLYKGLAVFILR